MAATALCYAGCGTAWAACYAAAGLVAGTITAGIGVPAAALACNAAEGTCMGYCIGVAAAEAPVTGGLSLLGALASCADLFTGNPRPEEAIDQSFAQGEPSRHQTTDN
eukprot:gene31907-7186_t